LTDYLLAIVGATRRTDLLALGVSTRGAMALHRAAKARALVRDREFCVPDDIRELAPAVLAHRVVLAFSDGARGPRLDEAERVIQDIADTVPVPL
jgi:MoxR-like ATPase